MIFLVFLCLSITYVKSLNTIPVVNTTQGWVQGTLADDGLYYAFYGIHYGGDTSGANRFKAPTPPPIYTDVYEATERNILCAQPSSKGLIGVENCLTLTVFTKNMTYAKPVIVWLVGEDFSSSNPLEYSFKRLVEEGLIVVAVNYRLSVFGFLCLGTEEAPGNAGLKDTMQALEWVKNNIAEFGGDPNNIILFGHGSGAAMTNLITLSIKSKGLVHKAVAVSGSALSPLALTMDPVDQAKRFAEELDLTTTSKKVIAGFLVNFQATSIVNAINRFELKLTNSVPFAPCIENVKLDPRNTFLDDTPYNLYRSGKFNDIPYVFGYTSGEGSVRVEHAIQRQWFQKMNSNFKNFIPIDLKLNENEVENIRDYYFGNRSVNMDTVEEYLRYHGDSLIVRPLLQSVLERDAKSDADTWLLSFRYISVKNSEWNKTLIPMNGVPHGGLLKYLLDVELDQLDKSMVKDIVAHFISFAVNGDPNSKGLSPWHPVSSSFISVDHIEYIIFHGGFNLTSESPLWKWSSYMDTNPQAQMRNHWEYLYERFYVPPISPSSGRRVDGFELMLIV